jgi:hypothetical protein
MPEKMTDRILPAEAMEQLDTRDQHLDAVVAMIREIDKAVLVMRFKHIGQITVADVALAADRHRDVKQLVEAVRELLQESST